MKFVTNVGKGTLSGILHNKNNTSAHMLQQRMDGRMGPPIQGLRVVPPIEIGQIR